MQRFWHPPLFCLAVAYLAFFFQLGNLLFVGADEPRYARIGYEMILQNDFVTPTLNHRPWLEKPPLLFWLEAAGYKVFGIGEGAARFPAALLALLGCGAMAFLAWRLWGTGVAFLTFLVLCTSILYFGLARAASTDMPLTAMLTVSVAAGFLAISNHSTGWAALAGLSLGLAALAKGPVAVVLFCGVFLLDSVLQGERTWKWKQMLALCSLFAVSALPWYWLVWKANGSNFILTFWINHHLARFVTDLHHHSQPFWYYLPVLLLGFFPWVFYLPSGMIRLFRNWGRNKEAEIRLHLFFWCWALTPILFFSLGSAKLPAYILPSLPPLALLVSLEWERFLREDLSLYRPMKIQLAIQQAFAVVLALALVFAFHFEYGSLPVGSLLALPLLGGAMGSLWEFHRGGRLTVFFWLVGSMALMAGLAAWKAAPVVEKYHSAGTLAMAARPLISREKPLILYRYFHHTAHYYAAYQTTPEAVDSLQQLVDYMKRTPQPFYILLTKKEGWQELRQALRPKLLGHVGNLYLMKITETQSAAAEGSRGRKSEVKDRKSRALTFETSH